MDNIGTSLVILLMSLAIFILIFLAIRAIVLCYCKIDTIVENQQKQIQLLRELVNKIKSEREPSDY